MSSVLLIAVTRCKPPAVSPATIRFSLPPYVDTESTLTVVDVACRVPRSWRRGRCAT